MDSMLPQDAAHAIESYLRTADRLLPGAVIACAVGGSIALGAYRPGRSDIDVVAVIGDEWKERRGLLSRLRLLHLSQLPRLSVRAGRGLGFSACCNTVFIWESEVRLPVSEIHPIGSHVGEIFEPAGAFDVNPVIWKQLVDGGISVRGGPVSKWGLDPAPEVLHEWVARNLHEYWTPLAESLGRNRRKLSAGGVEWCLLGPARMLQTLMTGDIISKEAAGQHALNEFPNHAPIIEVALARLRRDPIPTNPAREEWRASTGLAMSSILTTAISLE